MVKVSKAGGEIKKAIVERYNQDKRGFLETTIGFVLGISVSLFLLFNMVLPFPVIPKQAKPPSNFAQWFDLIKPFFLHLFALFGVMFFPMVSPFRIYTHWLFTIIIKVRNVIHYLLESKQKLRQLQ